MIAEASRARLDAEAALRQLSHDFAYCMDYQRYAELVELFTPDAVLGRVLEVHRGHREILDGVSARSAQIVTRHISTNFHFTHIDEETVRGVVYNVSYFGHAGDGPLPIGYGAPQGMLLDFHDLYKKTDSGWKFAERFARPVLLPEGSPMFRPDIQWRVRDLV